jgi:peptidoglycan-associated lipoprotein
MKNTSIQNLTLLGLLTLASLSACSHKQAKTEEPVAASSLDIAPIKDSEVQSSDKENAQGLQTVHFNYNAYSVDKSNLGQLKNNVKILKANPQITIQIEGHCDSRGGIQYNLALGEKRANSVKKFLVKSGISASRISTLSFGKEKPLDISETESAYAKNRRANFVVTK